MEPFLTSTVMLGTLAALGLLAFAGLERHRARRKIRLGDEAVFGIGSSLVVAGIILTVVVSMLLVARLLPIFADATADVNENLTDTNVTFGDETADGIKPVFAIVIGVAALFGIAGLVLKGFEKID